MRQAFPQTISSIFNFPHSLIMTSLAADACDCNEAAKQQSTTSEYDEIFSRLCCLIIIQWHRIGNIYVVVSPSFSLQGYQRGCCCFCHIPPGCQGLPTFTLFTLQPVSLINFFLLFLSSFISTFFLSAMLYVHVFFANEQGLRVSTLN